MGKCYESQDENIIKENIGKAHNHFKRCILDCYKYLCLAYSDYYESPVGCDGAHPTDFPCVVMLAPFVASMRVYYNDFKHQYRYTDLSVVDNGEFLPKLSFAVSEAKKKLFGQRRKKTWRKM